MRQLRLIDRIAATRGLDGVAGVLRDATQKVLRPGAVKDALHGVWLGHPLHPALAQLPVGCFLGATVLDTTGDRGPGASRLIGCGLPAALAGLADYADAHEEQQRVGVLHAAANSAGLSCYLGSLILRVRGSRTTAIALGLLGFGLVASGAALGGDLAFRRAVGPNHAAEVPHTGPARLDRSGAGRGFLGDRACPPPGRAHPGAGVAVRGGFRGSARPVQPSGRPAARGRTGRTRWCGVPGMPVARQRVPDRRWHGRQRSGDRATTGPGHPGAERAAGGEGARDPWCASELISRR
ncbi:MAG TPA: hypothetical protein VGJ45_24365 [Pseudonocardiaceae bacterium]